jgi:hypothetical protein
MEVEGGGWKLRALFSNTRRANELGRTRDWVVVYYRGHGTSGQCTVVTARRGLLLDLRVIRGREPECRQHYRQKKVA